MEQRGQKRLEAIKKKAKGKKSRRKRKKKRKAKENRKIATERVNKKLKRLKPD